MARGDRITERVIREAMQENRASEQDDGQLDELWTQLNRASTLEAPSIIRRMLQAAKREKRQEVVGPLQKMAKSIAEFDRHAEKVERILGY